MRQLRIHHPTLIAAAKDAERLGTKSPYVSSSNLDCAWRLGVLAYRQGRIIESLQPSRGYTWIVKFQDSPSKEYFTYLHGNDPLRIQGDPS